MKIAEAKKVSAFSVRLDLGKYNDELSGEYIVLKEPSYDDMAQLQQTADDQAAQTRWFADALPGLMVDSSFTFENGKPADAKSVAEVILVSADLTMRIVQDWTEACPFFSRNKSEEKSETVPLSTSKEETPDETAK